MIGAMWLIEGPMIPRIDLITRIHHDKSAFKLSLILLVRERLAGLTAGTWPDSWWIAAGPA